MARSFFVRRKTSSKSLDPDAEVGALRRDVLDFVEVDLLVVIDGDELGGKPQIGRWRQAEAEHLGVEGDRRIEVADGQVDVLDVVVCHGGSLP